LEPPFNLKGLQQDNKDDELGNNIFAMTFKEVILIYHFKKINFADYLFIRRANLAWQKCAENNILPLNNFPCAIYACVPGEFVYYCRAKYIYSFRIRAYQHRVES
jgi:hypothetical protein